MDDFEEGAVCGVDGCAPGVPAQAVGLAAHARILDLSIVSDVICPWCYIGKRRLEKALAMLGTDFPVRVTWRPFELNPTMPKGGVERSVYRMRKFGSLDYSRQLDAQVAAAGAGEGIPFRHDLMLRTPNTFDAHRLIWFGAIQGRQDALVETLFRAYFTEGRDVGDHETLGELAEAAGIERGRALALLEGDEGAEEVRADEMTAQHAGISGVPAFIANGQPLFAGAQRPDLIASVLRKVAENAGTRAHQSARG